MSLLLAMTGWHVEDWRARFQALLPDMPIVTLGEAFDRRAVHYVASWKHPEGSLTGLPNLAAIFSLGAGVDFLFADERLPEVPIARVVDPDLTTRMSEYIVLHCLMHLRQQRRYDRQQQAKLWDDDRYSAGGALGARRADGARRTRARRGPQAPGHGLRGGRLEPFAEDGRRACRPSAGEAGMQPFLARTDILVSLLPLTPETRGMIDAKLLAGLAQDGRLGGPFLINAGRGGLQVEADILDALDAGTLKGATLDVFESEPLPPDSRLWSHPAVTVTPHNAAMSEPEAIATLIAAQIGRLEAGKPLEHVVDPTRGY